VSYRQQPFLSVIIPTRNAGPFLAALLEAVQAQQVPGDVEIIVIDSQSQDGTPDLARQFGARLLSVSSRRFNHGRTRNQALEADGGEFVAMTVQDALPTDEHWLARLLAPLLEKPQVAGSYGLQDAPPEASLLARTRSAMWREAHAAPALKSLAGPDAFWEMAPTERLELIGFDDVTSCLRRSVWQKLPLPEYNFGEDMAWARNALLQGHQIAFVPEARVWHAHERGWWYELRRAYIDGHRRVELVDWPSPDLTPGEVMAILRRMVFFLRTNRFNAVVDPDEARRFLFAEMHNYRELAGHKPVQIYLDVLGFALAATRRALPFCPKGLFPEGACIQLFRFALVSLVGQNLGANAAALGEQRPSWERAFWKGLHAVLGRGV